MESILVTPYMENRVFDVDAQVFLTATGITDETQTIAINELCLALKVYDLWDKLKLIAPVVGGAETPHSFNLKNATAELIFNGDLVHDSNGVSGDGITGYIDLGYKPSDFAQNNFNMSIYNKYSVASNMLLGLSSPRVELYLSDNTYYSINESTEPSISNPNAKGFYSVVRDSGNSTAIYKDGSQAGTSSEMSSAPNDTLNIFALARNNGGTADYFSNGKIAFISLGESLSIAEQRKLFIAVQTYQIALGRNN